MKRILTENDLVRVLRRGIGYTAATAIVVVLLFGSLAAFDLRLGSEVIVNGNSVAIIYDYEGFNAIVAEVKELSKAASASETAGEYNIIYLPRLVATGQVTSDFKIRQALMADCTGMIEAYAVYVGGELVGATIKEDDVFGAFDALKDKYKQQDASATVEFDKDVTTRKEYIATKQLLSKEGLVLAMTGEQKHAELYTAGTEDTLYSVAESYGMTEDEIYSLNKNVDEQLHEGQIVNVTVKKPLVNVKSVYTAEYIEKIPYETEKIEDGEMAKGTTARAADGVEGERKIVATISKVNGIEIDRNIMSDLLVKNPQNERIKVGTNESMPATASEAVIDSTVAKTTGSFMQPTSGVITSRFGPRSRGNHTGLDLAGPTGTSIYAADGGTVTNAGWSGSYGKLVKIDHGNGYVTYYAHCSSIVVSVGQKVKKGQLISRIGSTGNSTGPHLHFEVRKNGVPQNPLSYLR